jgi:hypothetical protein
MLDFDGGSVVVTRNNQPPSKLSTHAQFRRWKGGGDAPSRISSKGKGVEGVCDVRAREGVG